MTSLISVIVVLAFTVVTFAKPGPYYTNLPVYNQYVGPYPNDYVIMRHARSPSGSSSGSNSGSSSFASSSSSAGGGATSGTFMSPGPGGGSGHMNAYAGSNMPPQYGGFPPFSYGNGNGYFNQFDFFNLLQQYFQQIQALQQQQAQEAAQNRFGAGGFGAPLDGNVVGGVATAQYSPQGGYGSASIFPAAEGGIDNRFGAPTPNGPVNSVSGSFPAKGTDGVFTSSSSGFSDINGHKTGFKTATVGVNKDGKVTTYSAHSP